LKPAPFGFAKARSVDDAIGLLAQNTDARLLAGGQSLIATLNMRLSAPKLLVDINALDELKRIVVKDGMVEIGALVRHAEAEGSTEIARHAPLIALAMPHIAHPAIRNRGTLGGSIALADPAAELPACLLALGGEVEVTGPEGPRTIAADHLFKGLFETAIGPHDMLTAIRLPAATPDRRTGFAEFARRHGDYAIVGLAATAQGDGAGVANIRLAFFGVDTKTIRARHAETALAHGPLDDARLDAAVESLDRDLEPTDDVQASAAAKRHMAGVLLRRVARQLAEAPP
jgi:carbon-monoxide dehydrogenase medium subunit